jgi:hypothetical protein
LPFDCYVEEVGNGTAAATAALRAMALGDCGGGSCNEDVCCNSRGKDNGNGGNGVGDDLL